MLAPEGYGIIVTVTAVALVLTAVGFWIGGIARLPLAVIALALVIFTLYFFRDPARTSPVDDGTLLLAPADGKVIEIVDVEHESLYLNGPARRISIFLSPLNVHVNRVPVSGIIESVRYVPGEYLVAWHEKASEKNERSEIGVRHVSGQRVMFKQIAGAVARRIVFHLKEGDEVTAGDRFGIVKFGSRMDVLVPPATEIRVSPGDRVVAGESILGSMDRMND
ncbi:MAG: phosphatidylserine decarboxylase family protein [Rhodothermales bacterium]|nr:phosphatidylserine decarboxylase family protein [Rhodothermales bacterium]